MSDNTMLSCCDHTEGRHIGSLCIVGGCYCGGYRPRPKRVVKKKAGRPEGPRDEKLARFQEAKAMRDQGWSLRRIAAVMGVTNRAIEFWLRELVEMKHA